MMLEYLNLQKHWPYNQKNYHGIFKSLEPFTKTLDFDTTRPS